MSEQAPTPDTLSTFKDHQRQLRFDMRRDFDPDSLLPVVEMKKEGWLAALRAACVRAVLSMWRR